ncbi:MAG: ribbon-helix-helix domain-containing protein [Anaerolineae bacterium]
MAMQSLKSVETVRTTVSLPSSLVERTQRLVDIGLARSRNALIVAALEHFLEHLERQAIDAQFAAMADDDAYHTFNLDLTDEFAESDWEALILAEEVR